MMSIEESPLGRVVLRPGRVFDAAAARRLHEILRRTATASTVLVDFRRVQDSHDAAMAMLAEDLASERGRVSVVGLCRHQCRLLRYFGIDEAEPDPDDPDSPAVHPPRG